MSNLICGHSVFDLLERSKVQRQLSSSSFALDSLLSKCLSWPGLYEFLGASACGKTQLCLQVLANFLQQDSGDALYIDSDANFSIERLTQLLPNAYSMEPLLKRIRYVTCEDYVDMLAELLLLDEMRSSEKGKLTLLIIDDFGSLLRTSLSDRKYFGAVDQLGTLLLKLVRSMSLCVLLTNSTNFQSSAEADFIASVELATQHSDDDVEDLPSAASCGTFESDPNGNSCVRKRTSAVDGSARRSEELVNSSGNFSSSSAAFDDCWSHYPTVRVLFAEAATEALRSFSSTSAILTMNQADVQYDLVQDGDRDDALDEHEPAIHVPDPSVEQSDNLPGNEEQDYVLLCAQILKAPFTGPGKSTLFRLDRRGIRDAF